MTKKELVEALKDLPDDLPILTRGYESGYDLSREVRVETLFRDPNPVWYEGEYQESDCPDHFEKVKAIVINNGITV